MAVTTKVQPLDSWISLAVEDALSPSERAHAIAEFARGALIDAQMTNKRVLGADAAFSQFVDGKRGAALEAVNPDRGVIVFEFEMMSDVVRWILDALVERSPVRSGAYRAGHRLFADGSEIDKTGSFPPAAEFSVTNTEPYSRKLEIGKTESGRDFLVSVPNRIYQRTAKDARARFGNVAQIRFTYRGIVGGAQVNAEKMPSTLKRARNRKGRFVSGGGPAAHNVRQMRFPTITISLD